MPVYAGWQLEQTSKRISSFFVEVRLNESPQAQVALIVCFLGLIFLLYATNSLGVIFTPIYALINLIQNLFGLPM